MEANCGMDTQIRLPDYRKVIFGIFFLFHVVSKPGVKKLKRLKKPKRLK